MKHRLSFAAVLMTGLMLVSTRITYSELCGWSAMKVTTWDAFGYYQYLPGILIHQDIARQAWVEEADSAYQVIGTGGLYQLMPLENGDRVAKYFCGVALLELPFFLIGHAAAGLGGFPQDGFSPPYQWAISIAPIVYCIIALFLLRAVLLRWYPDRVVAPVVLLLVLATNAVQYISVDGAQTHGFLFALYALILWATVKWHETPDRRWAILIGATIGLATVTRPTEAIMVFIPLLWGTGPRTPAANKWAQVSAHRSHILFASAAGFLMFLPQLIYWKYVTGSFLFDVGSKWDFLSPHWRVLFGWEKGWFIYTPITLLFIPGWFLSRGKPWRMSALVFILLNIWIVIAWHDWRYGGSYSARALVQCYPVLALPFAELLYRVRGSAWRWPIGMMCAYLLFVNLFQVWQYNNGVIKYDGMTRQEYMRVYLDPHPSPL